MTGNIYVPPKNFKQLLIFKEVLEKLKSKDLMIIRDFNAQNSVRDKHFKSNSKLGVFLEHIILRHGLYVATNADHTYQQSASCETFGKSTTDLNPTKEIKNISIKTLNVEKTNIKTRHKAIVILVGENDIISVFTKMRNDLKPAKTTGNSSESI